MKCNRIEPNGKQATMTERSGKFTEERADFGEGISRKLVISALLAALAVVNGAAQAADPAAAPPEALEMERLTVEGKRNQEELKRTDEQSERLGQQLPRLGEPERMEITENRNGDGNATVQVRTPVLTYCLKAPSPSSIRGQLGEHFAVPMSC